jgi:hypothetical protein
MHSFDNTFLVRYNNNKKQCCTNWCIDLIECFGRLETLNVDCMLTKQPHFQARAVAEVKKKKESTTIKSKDSVKDYHQKASSGSDTCWILFYLSLHPDHKDSSLGRA